MTQQDVNPQPKASTEENQVQSGAISGLLELFYFCWNSNGDLAESAAGNSSVILSVVVVAVFVVIAFAVVAMYFLRRRKSAQAKEETEMEMSGYKYESFE